MESTRRTCYICKKDYDSVESYKLRNSPIIQSISLIDPSSGELVSHPICHVCGNICNIIMDIADNESVYRP